MVTPTLAFLIGNLQSSDTDVKKYYFEFEKGRGVFVFLSLKLKLIIAYCF